MTLIIVFVLILAAIVYGLNVLEGTPSGTRQTTRSRAPRRPWPPERRGGTSSPHAVRDPRKRLISIANNLPRGRLVRTAQHPTVEAKFRRQPARLRVIQEVVEYELETGGAEALDLQLASSEVGFDVAYQGVHGAAQAAQLLNSPDAKVALNGLNRDGIFFLQIGGGKIVAKGDVAMLMAERARRILRSLDQLGRIARTIQAHARAPLPIETSAKTIDWSARRCPYCHESLGDGGDRAACETCHTVHHEECFEELGRCTTMACAGRRCLPVLERNERVAISFSTAPCGQCGLRSRGCTPEQCFGTAVDRFAARRRA